MTPIQHIELHQGEFTKSELVIMDYVLTHLDKISDYPIATIAEKCKVSKSALLRFCQKCGFKGYSEFRYEVSRYIQSITQITESDNVKTQTITNLYIEALNQLPTVLSMAKLNQLSQLILQARKIKIYGIHETGLSARYFSYRLASVGIDSEDVTFTELFSEKASMSQEDDLNIFLSLSAETGVVKEAIQYASESGSRLVLITQDDHHRFKNRINLDFILPTFHLDQKSAFVDSQAIVLIAIDLIINNVASHLSKKKLKNDANR